MRVIALRTLRDYWATHADAEEALKAWYSDARHADWRSPTDIRARYANWRSPTDIRARYANASILSDNRVVFTIRGNTYRLIVAINYEYGIIYIRFVGTHAEYDKIDAETV